MSTNQRSAYAKRLKYSRRAAGLASGASAGYAVSLYVAGEPRGALGWLTAAAILLVNEYILGVLRDAVEKMEEQAKVDSSIIEALLQEQLDP